jgi:dihydrodipicolinate synthase/N-acetylneuraminate lyase
VTHIWEGVMPAVTTKFNADFSIDRAWTAKNVDAQIEAGVDGIIVCGSLGEASTLSLDEKLDVLDIAVDAARGRVPVLLTIAENSTLDGCRQAERAARHGAAGYMVLPGLRYLSDRREPVAAHGLQQSARVRCRCHPEDVRRARRRQKVCGDQGIERRRTPNHGSHQRNG